MLKLNHYSCVNCSLAAKVEIVYGNSMDISGITCMVFFFLIHGLLHCSTCRSEFSYTDVIL